MYNIICCIIYWGVLGNIYFTIIMKQINKIFEILNREVQDKFRTIISFKKIPIS